MKQAEFNNFITFKKVQIAGNVFDINLGYYDDILLDFSQSLCVLLLDYMIICLYFGSNNMLYFKYVGLGSYESVPVLTRYKLIFISNSRLPNSRMEMNMCC